MPNNVSALYWTPVTDSNGKALGLSAQRDAPAGNEWDVYNPATGGTTRYAVSGLVFTEPDSDLATVVLDDGRRVDVLSSGHVRVFAADAAHGTEWLIPEDAEFGNDAWLSRVVGLR